MVDTGCQITTISVKDSVPFYQHLPPPSTKTLGVSGSIETSVLFDCSIAFDLVHSIHLEKIHKVHVLSPSKIQPEDFKNLLGTPSVLGMDVLSRYYITFDPSIVTLEK